MATFSTMHFEKSAEFCSTSFVGAQVSLQSMKSDSDVDKGPFLHVSSSGLVAAENLEISNSGMGLSSLILTVISLFWMWNLFVACSKWVK